MATIKMTKNDSYGYGIENPLKDSSPNNTYIPVENALKTGAAVDFNLKLSSKDFFVRNGNDLSIISVFS